MMYLDSSVLVCLLSSETRTDALQIWFSEQDPEQLYISEWNITEFHSAMSFKRRTGQISAGQRLNAERVFQAYIDAYFQTFPVSSVHFRRAATIAGRDDINLRAPDALHLAIAETNHATIFTMDKKMHQAAQVIGIDCLMP